MLDNVLIGLLMLVVLVTLVVAHEFGHFLVAKRNGVQPEEFGIFFPPRLWGRKMKGGWTFSINALPLGGFVKLKGELDSDRQKGGYGAAPLSVKAKILLAGVGMNFLVAFVLLTILAFVGMPQLVNKQFTIKSDTHIAKNEVLAAYIENNSPASKAGIVANDQIVAFIPKNGQVYKVTNADNLPDVTKNYAGQTVGVEFVHAKHTEVKQVTFRSSSVVAASDKTNNPKGYLGLVASQYTLTRSTWSAPIVAVGVMVQFTALTFQGLGSALHGVGTIIAATLTGNHAAREIGQAQANQLAGPVGIFKLLKSSTSLGFLFILMITAIISLSLAIINVLPIPPLDGGKLFMTLVARMRGKRLSERIEILANIVGFAFFLIIFVLLTIGDAHKHF